MHHREGAIFVSTALWQSPLCGSVLAQGATNATFGNVHLAANQFDAGATTRRAQKFLVLLSPLMSGAMGLAETLEGHVVGAGAILLYALVKRFWTAEPEAQSDQAVPPKFTDILPYALVVSATMMAALGLGGKLLKSDPTIIAAASLNVISPSARQTWVSALERMIFAARLKPEKSTKTPLT